MTEFQSIDLFSERARLVALLAKLFGSVMSYNDPEYPTWPVVYVETPAGQMSWHFHPDDVRHVDFLAVVPDYPWDMHTTWEKYRRLAALTGMIPQGLLTHATPRLDTR